MPRPRFDETKKAFVARCISEVRKDGLTTEKAVVKCFLIWERAEEELEASNPEDDK